MPGKKATAAVAAAIAKKVARRQCTTGCRPMTCAAVACHAETDPSESSAASSSAVGSGGGFNSLNDFTNDRLSAYGILAGI